MKISNDCNTVIAKTVLQIISSQLGSGIEAVHKCFRVKNLRKDEILKFIEFWTDEAASYGLQNVKVVIAGDSGTDYPAEYKAEKNCSITWYRNNNEYGLIYLETKTESDEQGLKNIFTPTGQEFP